MRPLLRNTVELPGPALTPGPAAHNLELNLRLPQSVYISMVRFVPRISKGSRGLSVLLLTAGRQAFPGCCKDGRMTQLHALVTYVPAEHAATVLAAVGDAGAGRIGNYSHCAFTTPGTGRFTPLPGSQPFVGAQGHGEQVPEIRIECVVAEELLDAVVAALRSAHPYEEPALMSWAVNGHRPPAARGGRES
jgi:hypothetical protein